MIHPLLQVQCPCSEGRSSPLLLLALIAGTWLAINWIRAGGKGSLGRWARLAIVGTSIAAIVLVVAVGQRRSVASAAAHGPEQLTGNGRPVLVDLGADMCGACKRMAPILETLKVQYAGVLDVHFLDVHKNPALGSLYGIRGIPTQIFYGPSGEELFRHEGFYSQQDILDKWRELGFVLTSNGEDQGETVLKQQPQERNSDREYD